MARMKRAVLLITIFAVVFATHFRSPVVTSYDSMFSIPTAMSILAHGDTDLDEYPDLLKQQDYYNISTIGGHDYSRYSIGVPLMALPLVAARDVLYRVQHGCSLETYLQKDLTPRFEKAIASSIIALASVFIFLIAELRITDASKPFAAAVVLTPWGRTRLSLDRKTLMALVITFVFAFCTSAWSTGSRGLWQHGPSMLLFSAALYLLLREEKHPAWMTVTGALLAFSYVVRPTNILPAAVLALFVLYRNWRQFLWLLAGSAPIMAAFFAYNYSLFGSVLSEYYSPSSHWGFVPYSHWGFHQYFEALAGHLISPSRGLFIYSPVFLLVFAGAAIKLREKPRPALDIAILALLVLQILMISFGARWYAGHCFGPRYVSDVTPFFIWFLIPIVDRFRAPMTWGITLLAALFVLLTAASFYVNYQGANNGYCMWWNSRPIPVDKKLDRLWDWKDPQFLRHSLPARLPDPEPPGS